MCVAGAGKTEQADGVLLVLKSVAEWTLVTAQLSVLELEEFRFRLER
jgi:hypothetical protein